MVNKWITDNYEELKRTTYNILAEDDYENVDDLLHECIVMFLNNKNAEGVVERGEAKWFFIRILLNQYRSKTSYYHKTYRVKNTAGIEIIDEITDSIIDEEYDIDKDVLVSLTLDIIEQMLKSDDNNERYYGFIIMMYFSNDYNFAEVARKLNVSRSKIRRQFDEGVKIIMTKLNKTDNNINYNQLPLKMITTQILKTFGNGRRY